VHQLTRCKDTNKIAISVRLSKIAIWDINNEEVVQEIFNPNGNVNSMKLNYGSISYSTNKVIVSHVLRRCKIFQNYKYKTLYNESFNLLRDYGVTNQYKAAFFGDDFYILNLVKPSTAVLFFN